MSGTRCEEHPGVASNARVDRRKKNREMHLDRRKSVVDLIERLVQGANSEGVRVTADDRPRRTNRRRRR